MSRGCGRVAIVGGKLADLRDTPILRRALQTKGVIVDAVSWRDAEVDWSTYDLALLRFCWDYGEDLDAFIAWVRSVSVKATVLNPPDLVPWNARMTYLIDLGRSAIPIVPTKLVESGVSVAAFTGLEGELG